jgi:hypothetical protein
MILAAAHQLEASSNTGVDTVAGIIWLVIFVVVLVDIWRSPATVGPKVGWSIFLFFCSLIALIGWLIFGRRSAYRTR